MKLKTFFAESKFKNHPYKDLSHLLSEVEKYFEISNFKIDQTHVISQSPVMLSADLRVKMSIKFKSFPLYLDRLHGKLDLRSSGIEDLSDLPNHVTTLTLGMSDTGPVDLSTARHISVPELIIDGLQSITSLQNSGMTVVVLKLSRCSSLTSLRGIENFIENRAANTGDAIVIINQCPLLSDDLMDYSNKFDFTFKDKKIPPRMPVRVIIAQYGNREFPQIDHETINELKKKYPTLAADGHFGGGAESIFPITKYFRSQGMYDAI